MQNSDIQSKVGSFYEPFNLNGLIKFKPAHQRHSHESVRWSEFKAVSGQSESFSTSDSNRMEFIIDSRVRGPIDRVYTYLPFQSSAADTFVGPRAVKDLRYDFGNDVKTSLWDENNICFDSIALMTDDKFYQLDGHSGLTTAYAADTLTIDTEYPLLVDITGPIRPLGTVPGALNQNIRVSFRLNATGGFMDASLGTITTNSSSIKLLVKWYDDGELEDHRLAYSQGFSSVFFIPHPVPAKTLSGTTTLSRYNLGISENQLSAFAVIYNVDESADKNDALQYSATTSHMLVDQAGNRIFADSNLAITQWEQKNIQADHFPHTTSLSRANILVSPTGCSNAYKSYIHGELNGVWRIPGDQAGITFTSADSNSDKLWVYMYLARRIRFANNEAQSIDDVKV